MDHVGGDFSVRNTETLVVRIVSSLLTRMLVLTAEVFGHPEVDQLLNGFVFAIALCEKYILEHNKIDLLYRSTVAVAPWLTLLVASVNFFCPSRV